MERSDPSPRPGLADELRAAPTVLPCAVALGVAGWWALDQGGSSVQRWAAGALVVLGLLAVAFASVANRWRDVPRPVALAAALLGSYTLWSFASIAWADDPGFAWEGAGRTLLYAAAFALFALWPQRGRTALGLVELWVALVGLAGVVLAVRLTGSADPASLFGDDRLKAPTGYPNATAALLLMPLAPAVVLSASRAVAWWGRGLAAAAAVLLGALALLTISRGAVFSLPIVLVGLLVLLPGRVRHLFALAPVAVAVAVCAPRLLDVGDRISGRGDLPAALDRAVGLALVAALVAGVVVGAFALLEQRRPWSATTGRRLRLAAQVVAGVVVVGALAGGLVLAGNPVDRVDSAWNSFKGGYGDNAADRNRLVSGLGSNRYDFYRVALDTFGDHPVAGVGADNFYQQYLQAGRSTETPRYPHSVELRTLSQTGLVGAVLLLGFGLCALWAALRAMRAGGSEAAAAAGAGTMAFVYWVVHGSVDWFWEWPGLGLPAFALLGLACALVPRRQPAVVGRPTTGRRVALVAGMLGALVAAVPLASLWLADREQRVAAATFPAAPLSAFAHLDRAASLNPFSSSPRTLEGSIALRFGDLPRADAAFGGALDRVPDDQYATLERGAIASARGERARSLVLLRRATALAPRDLLAREALQIVRSGGAVDVTELNRRIFEAAQQLAG